MKTTILLAAIFLFSSVSQAQYVEQRPAPPAPAARDSARGSDGHHYREFDGFDFDSPLPGPLEINTSGSTPSVGSSMTQGPATAYAHGDPNAPFSNIFVAPRTQTAPRAQAAPPAGNVSGQFQQLVQARSAANSGPQTQPRLQMQNTSLADLARQVRAEKATEEKATVKIKQDVHGNAILVEKKQ